jgi:hypothetical protein
LPQAGREFYHQNSTNPYTGKPIYGPLTGTFPVNAMADHAVLSGVKSITDIPKRLDALTAQVGVARWAYEQAELAVKRNPRDPGAERALQEARAYFNQTKLYAAKAALPLATQTGLLPLAALGAGGGGLSALALGASGQLAGPATQGAAAAAGAKPGHRSAAFGRGFLANIGSQEKENWFAIPSQIATDSLPFLHGPEPLPTLDTTPLLSPDLAPIIEEGPVASAGARTGRSQRGIIAPSAGKVPVQENEVTTYQDFKNRSDKNDNLEGHEVWQHSNMKAHGLVTRRLSTSASRKNPILVLRKPKHTPVTAAQQGFDAANQTPIENINANAAILRNQNVAPENTIAKVHRMAIEHANKHGYDK